MASSWRRFLWLTVLVSATSVAGCRGTVDGAAGGRGGEKPREVEYPPGFEDGLEDEPAPGPRVMRLTHSQWENTVRDLFGLSEATGLSSSFRTDAGQTTLFQNDPNLFEVDSALWGAYQGAATNLAARVRAEAELRAAILPAGTSEDLEGAKAFIEAFGKRAHRRPLTEDEVAEYLAIYSAGAAFFPDETPFVAGLGTLIEAFLQSPFFLYRIETSTEVAGGKIPLGGYEIASRLSYTLWNTMPDETLFSLAEGGELTDPATVKEQAERLLADPRAKDTLVHFHDVIFRSSELDDIAPPDSFGLSADFGVTLHGAQTQDFEDKIVARDLGLAGLLTEPTAFANAELGGIYGIDGLGDTLEQVNLDDDVRAGVLTHVPFLALNANTTKTDPIHRGLQILTRLACVNPGAAPGTFTPPEQGPGQTTREIVANYTEQDGTNCAGCHKNSINRFGFPFENLDAVGAPRATENDADIVTADVVPLDGDRIDVADGVALSFALAESPQAHRCYAENWVAYAYGRKALPGDSDQPLIERLGGRSLDELASAKEVLVGLIVTDAFLTRSTEELPEEEVSP